MNRDSAISSASLPCWNKLRTRPAPMRLKKARAWKYRAMTSGFCWSKPHAGMDLLTTLGRQLHAAQNLVRSRASRNPNDVIGEKTTMGEHIADAVAQFGGSWRFIILFSIILIVYTVINVALDKKA